MDPIKEAFAKAKQDIAELRSELAEIKLILSNISSTTDRQTDKHINSSNETHIINKKEELNEPYTQISNKTLNFPQESSIGNRGVPTNRQTNQQTNKQINHTGNTYFEDKTDLTAVLESFDSIKEQLKIKFKSLTKQEMSVFVAIYILEEQKKEVDYPTVASHLGLTETSIRDYVLKMTKKGIPLVKTKQNNKRILLSIDPSLRKIAPLSSIFMLRDPTSNFKNRLAE